MSPKVFVCLLSWNKRDETLSCLRHALAQNYPNLRVVVVDNGSTDGSLLALRELRCQIDLIEHQENLGFTGGCNAGMRHALAQGGDYIWLLNTDTECEKDALSRLIAYAEARPEVGMLSPIIADRRGEDKYALGRLDLTTGHYEETADPGQADAMQKRHPDQLMLKGTALLVKRCLIERVGFLDDRFFAYCEDNDYSIRCASAGFRAACVTTVRIYHDEGPGAGQPWRKPYAFHYAVRNGILFWRKHARGLKAWKFALWHACTIFRVLARGGFGRAETEAFADGLWSGLRGSAGRWDPSLSSHRMPSLLRRIFIASPAVSLWLMEASPRTVFRALFRS